MSLTRLWLFLDQAFLTPLFRVILKDGFIILFLFILFIGYFLFPCFWVALFQSKQFFVQVSTFVKNPLHALSQKIKELEIYIPIYIPFETLEIQTPIIYC